MMYSGKLCQIDSKSSSNEDKETDVKGVCEEFE